MCVILMFWKCWMVMAQYLMMMCITPLPLLCWWLHPRQSKEGPFRLLLLPWTPPPVPLMVILLGILVLALVVLLALAVVLLTILMVGSQWFLVGSVLVLASVQILVEVALGLPPPPHHHCGVSFGAPVVSSVGVSVSSIAGQYGGSVSLHAAPSHHHHHHHGFVSSQSFPGGLQPMNTLGPLWSPTPSLHQSYSHTFCVLAHLGTLPLLMPLPQPLKKSTVEFNLYLLD